MKRREEPARPQPTRAKGAAPTSAERLQRLLALVPYVVSRKAVGLADTAAAFVFLQSTAGQDQGPKIKILVAKRDLRAGEMLDGEGGYTVWGRLMPAAASLKAGALPIGLAHKVKLKNDIAHGAVVKWSDVEVDADNDTIKTRRAMEAKFAGTG